MATDPSQISSPGRGAVSPLILGLSVLAVVAGAIRIASTYGSLYQTSDEPCHVACGLAWLDRGDVGDLDHPPLARVLCALGPYARGLRTVSLDGTPDAKLKNPEDRRFAEGERILRLRGTYIENLRWARLGTLPFFLVGAFLVWRWSARLFGSGAALAATFLFSDLPPVLAHSGLATTDVASMTTVFGSVLALVTWLDVPSVRRSVLLGVAVGLAAIAKFSAFLFLPVCAIAVLALRFVGTRRAVPFERPFVPPKRRLGGLVFAALVACLVVWAGYRFTLVPLLEPAGRPHPGVTRRLHVEGVLGRHPGAQRAFFALAEAPVPAGDLVRGLVRLRRYNSRGHLEYFLGEFRMDGWRSFFPVMFAVKTPVAFLVLLGVGVAALFRRSVRGRWESWVPLASAGVIFLVCLPSHLNLGLRHVLPVYPFLAVVAGLGLASLWDSGRGGAVLAVVLGLWFAVSAFLAHPDYLAYFNELAGSNPERITADSDLDWGQGLFELRDRARRLAIPSLWLGYEWTSWTAEAGLPDAQPLPRYRPTSGWIAISEFTYRIENEKERRRNGRAEGPYEWLTPYPYERVGRSFRLYHLP